MGSYCSCLPEETIPDNHPNKFKVINVDDDGNELESGIMELTETELILSAHKRDSVKWHYLCLCRYGCDSDLFTFECSQTCQTGPGIFAFKCTRAEEFVNMLQEILQNSGINMVEGPVVDTNPHQAETESLRTPQTSTMSGLGGQSLRTGYPRRPSYGDASSYPSSRHPSVGSARLPTVTEESMEPLLVTEAQVHTHVNTTGVQEERKNKPAVFTPLERKVSNAETSRAREDESCSENRGAQVLLESEGKTLVLGPTPVQRQLMEKGKLELSRNSTQDTGSSNSEGHPGQDSDEHKDVSSAPVWEAHNLSAEDDGSLGPKPPFLSFCHNNFHRMHTYVNTENVMGPSSAPSSTPTGFHFDVRRSSSEHRPLNYIQADWEGCSDSDNPRTLETPSVPLPWTRARHSEYAVIDPERTAALATLKKALPKEDGTSRKTRHNSTDLFM